MTTVKRIVIGLGDNALLDEIAAVIGGGAGTRITATRAALEPIS